MQADTSKDSCDFIHDNKMWGVRFNFDSGQFLIPPHLIIDIDFEINSELSLPDNEVIFHISPAELVFNFVSSFSFNVSSDPEMENNYLADCLYIDRLIREPKANGRSYFKITFCNAVGYMDFHAQDFSLIINEKKVIKVKGSDYIPLPSRLSLSDEK